MDNPYQNLWGEPNIGETTKIAAFVEIGKGVTIGERCKIEAFVFIPPGVTIEDDVFIGPHVCFVNDKHPSNEWGDRKILATLIKRGANIGANATILPVTIGEGAVIGAGAVVTKDVPPNETWVGNPAHRIDKGK